MYVCGACVRAIMYELKNNIFKTSDSFVLPSWILVYFVFKHISDYMEKCTTTYLNGKYTCVTRPAWSFFPARFTSCACPCFCVVDVLVAPFDTSHKSTNVLEYSFLIKVLKLEQRPGRSSGYTQLPVRMLQGCITRSPHIWDLIHRPLHWKVSSVGCGLYGCSKRWSYNAV